MSKELTEQWRAGTLPTGSYYIRIITGNEKSDYFEGKRFCFWSDYEVEEVIAPVPNYEKVKEMSQKIERLEFDNEAFDNELKELATKNDTLVIENGRLQEQLRIATNALKEYATNESYKLCVVYCHYGEPVHASDVAVQALKGMEGVK